MADEIKPAKRKKTGGRKPILDPELVAAAIVSLSGNLAAVARRFNVQRASVCELVNKRPSLQKVLADARATMVDNVESRFYSDCLKEGAAYQTSRIFFLKTQGRTRGYIERPRDVSPESSGGPTRLVIEDGPVEILPPADEPEAAG